MNTKINTNEQDITKINTPPKWKESPKKITTEGFFVCFFFVFQLQGACPAI